MKNPDDLADLFVQQVALNPGGIGAVIQPGRDLRDLALNLLKSSRSLLERGFGCIDLGMAAHSRSRACSWQWVPWGSHSHPPPPF